MANNEAGAFLNITPDVLKKLDSFDEKLEKIEKHAHTAADALKNGFGKVVIDTTKLENAITSLASKINALNSAGNVVQNIGTSMNQVSKDATKAASSLSSVAQSINKVKPDNSLAKSVEQYRSISSQIEQVSSRQKQLNDIIKSYELTMSRIQNGKGGVIQAGQQQQVQAARQEFEENNKLLSTLKQKQKEIVNTNVAYQKQIQLVEQLKTNNQAQSSLPNQRSQQTLADMRAYYSELEKSSARAAKAAEKAATKEEKERERVTAKAIKDAERKASADEKAAQRAAKAAAESAKAQNYQKNTTTQGALDFSKTANTLQRQITAIEYLKKARLSLNTTDANYKNTLNQINQAIAKHNQALTEAGVKSQQLATRHRNLMDTAGKLSRQLALVFSVSQIEGYIGKLVNVRGEFELQQRSLQAILQNKSQADQIFNKTVQLAVKSPYKIKELVSFTKQLAAYRIESSKLYDTTKRLADASAGLGVDMGRLILAYGQVKAAAYLRGTEVRQFTEAGINLYGELQRYFEEVKGEAYTTAQIVDMISKRKVTFEDIENIFQRLTDEGGLFYNMQEIQAETLQGKISNLQDSIDVMLNSIGKANEGVLKGSIDGARALVENWEKVAAVLQIAVGAFLHIKTTSMIANTSLFKTMSLTFAYQRSLNATKMQAFFTSLQAGWKETARTLASSVGAISKALSGAAIFVALNSLMTYFQNSSTHAKRIREITDEQEKENALVSKLVNSYNKLKVAESSEKTENFNGENFEEKKKKLEELYRIFDKRTIKIPVELEKVTPENIDAVFNDAEKKLKGINNIISNALKYIEKDKANIEIFGFTPFSESIIENTEEYEDAVLELLSYKSDVEKAFDVATNNYQKLNKEAKKYYEDAKSLSDKYTKGEITNVEYIKGVYEALEIMRVAQQHKEVVPPMWVAKIGNHLNQLNYEMKTYEGELASAKISWKELLNYMNNADGIISKINKGELSPKDFELTLDRIATDNNFSEGALEAFKSFAVEWANRMGANGLSFNIEKEDVKQELDGLDVIFKKWFSSHTYKLDINYGDIGDKNIGKGIIEEGDNMAAAYKNAALVVERLKKSLDATFNQKQSGLSADLWSKYFGASTEISKEQLIKTYEDIAKINKQAAIDAGWIEESRAERDIWSERISVLKEMQSRYEKLNQLMGENQAIAETRSAFKGALDFTQMGEVIKPEDIIPTKKGMIDALEKLLKQIPDIPKYAAKRTGLEKEIAELKIGIQQDYLKEQLEKTKKNIEDMFNGLDLHQKLKDAGLSESEVKQLFPGLAKTLDDVQKGIEAEYQKRFPKGEYLTPDTTANKQYLADLDKLNQQRIKEQQDLVVELTKSYKTQLSDQLQLDRWYYEERAKIQRANLTDEQKGQYEANLQKQYGKKSDENTWKQFQNSDMYISMFENIESSSTRMLEAMREKLASLRENLKNLPADQLKAIINQQEKIDEMISQKNPFSGLTSGVKEYIQFLKQRKELEEENIRANNAVAYYTEQKNIQSNIIQQKQLEYNKEVELNGVGSAKALNLKLQLEYEKKQLDIILKKLVAEGKITEETAEQIRNGQKLGKTLSDKFSEIGNNLSEFSSGITDVASNLENVFGTMSAGTADTISSIAEIASGLGQTASGVGRIMSGDVIGGGIQAIGGLAKTIGSIFNIKDKKKEREIQRQIKNIEELGKKYDELKEKMEAAWSADDLRTQTKDTVANLDQQIASYQAMIKAEQDKKKTDKDRINEWNEAINELEKTKKEILEEERKYMGGIGGEEEYRSAAESFVQAWMDAFNETGDGLKGLEENFDDMINNLFLKQVSMRVVNKMLAPIFDIVDASVSEIQEAIDRGSDFEDILKEKIAAITDKADNILPVVNEILGGLYSSLGLGNNKTAELSSLTQSIQGVTEQTAEELAALLGSVRFFVSQQTTDISAIRALLDARYSLESEYSDSNPMLVELRAQTGYLEILSDRIDRVFATNANSRGAGLRVYMQ